MINWHNYHDDALLLPSVAVVDDTRTDATRAAVWRAVIP